MTHMNTIFEFHTSAYWRNRFPGRDSYVTFASFVIASSAAIVGFEETATCMLSTSHSASLTTAHSGVIEIGMILLSKLGVAIGALASLPWADTHGRLVTIRWAAFAHFFLSFWSCYVRTVWAQMSSRFVVNIAIGCMISTAPLYLVEISTGFDRGSVCSAYFVCYCTGCVVSCALFIILTTIYGDTAMCNVVNDDGVVSATACDDPMPGWATLYYFVPGLLSLGMTIIIPALPESPRWLLAHKTPDECLDSLKALRKTNDVKGEFSDIYQALTLDARQEDTWGDLLTNETLRYRVFLICCLPLCHEATGAELSKVRMYSLANSIHLALPLEMLGTLLGSLVGAYICFRYIDKLGRQIFMVGSCLGVSITWLLAAWCVTGIQSRHGYGHSTGTHDINSTIVDSEPLSVLLIWLVGAFTIQAAFFNSGLQNLLCFLQAEIFPLRARSRGMVLATVLKAIISCTFDASYNRWLSMEAHSSSDPDHGSEPDPNVSTGAAQAPDGPVHLSRRAMVTVFTFFGITAAVVAAVLYVGVPDMNEIMLEDAEEIFMWDENDSCVTILPWIPCSLSSGCIGRRKFLIKDQRDDESESGEYDHRYSDARMGAADGADTRWPHGGSSADFPDAGMGFGGKGKVMRSQAERQAALERMEMASTHKYSAKMRDGAFQFIDASDGAEVAPAETTPLAKPATSSSRPSGTDFFRFREGTTYYR